ncbi:hypothetical protein, partial [Pseudomonas aeruginosa]|uniref:hypothetical protein n=1 Tax=Pseudomonas aeruginosa TaxID=287 RepID=UPI003F68A4F8
MSGLPVSHVGEKVSGGVISTRPAPRAPPAAGAPLGEAIREQPEQARLALTLAAAESERFVRQGTG